MEFETSTKRYSENIETPTFTTLADFSTEFRTSEEIQEYPEIGYSLQERNTLGDVISSEIGNLIADMLPGENENEQ